ncbi:hypothetical protein ACP26L_01685 [Paenibacillus sp. S-38]|uniref:hypothetical protein n=1 Tax=Paenibacillus sp. S-38 TaxID=3416710 RepID=UPI003CF4711A
MTKPVKMALRVLLVTADTALASYIERILTQALGVRCVHVHSFGEASLELAQESFDVVLAEVDGSAGERLDLLNTYAPLLVLAREEARPAARRAVVEEGAVLYMIREGLSPDTLIGAVIDAVERPGTLTSY